MSPDQRVVAILSLCFIILVLVGIVNALGHLFNWGLL